MTVTSCSGSSDAMSMSASRPAGPSTPAKPAPRPIRAGSEGVAAASSCCGLGRALRLPAPQPRRCQCSRLDCIGLERFAAYGTLARM